MKLTRALLVGGKKDYARAYQKLQRELLSVFNIEAEWDIRGKKPITADRYDLVLITVDIVGHNISATVTAAAKRAGIPTRNIVRSWIKTLDRLKADFEVRKPSLPQMPAPESLHTPPRIVTMTTASKPIAVPDVSTLESALFESAELPAEVEALVEQVRAACVEHRVTSLHFDLQGGEVVFAREVVRVVHGIYKLKEAA